MTLPPDAARRIEKALEDFASSSDPFLVKVFDPALDMRSLARELRVLPLLLDMGGCYAVRTNGELVSFGWDDPYVLTPEPDERIRNIALFQGSKRFPELEFLVPVRPFDAVVCPHCKGTGEVPNLPAELSNVLCGCGGLGWVPS